VSAVSSARETGWCTFTLAGGLYGVAVSRTHEVLRPQPLTRVPLAPAAVAGLLNLRGQIVPAVDLRVPLGLEPGAAPGAFVVVRGSTARGEAGPGLDDRAGAGLVALLVDEIGDFRRAGVPASLPAREGDSGSYTAGVVPLADRLLVVLDLDRLLERVFERDGRETGARGLPVARPPGAST
jgi:purine-binding chemotaxis protein CheW